MAPEYPSASSAATASSEPSEARIAILWPVRSHPCGQEARTATVNSAPASILTAEMSTAPVVPPWFSNSRSAMVPMPTSYRWDCYNNYRFSDRGERQESQSPGQSSLLTPVLAPEPFDTIEFAKIPGHDNYPTAPCVPGDQQIISADPKSPTFEHCTNISGMSGSIRIERKNLQPTSKPLDLPTVMIRPSRLCGAMKQFRQHDRRYAKAVGFPVEPIT